MAKRRTTETRGRPPKEADLSTYRGRFGANLRRLRQKRFATLDEFADALGEHIEQPPVATIARWERGERIPDLELWPIIADLLRVKPRNLLPAE